MKRPKLRIDADTDDVYLRCRVRFVAGTTVASGEARLQPAVTASLDATQRRLKSQTSFLLPFVDDGCVQRVAWFS